MRWVADRVPAHRLTSPPYDLDANWIVSYMRDLAHRDVFEIARPGEYTGYDDLRTYRVRPGTRLLPEHVSMRRHDRLREILKEFRTLRDQRPELAGIRLQISLPSPLDVAIFVFSSRPWSTLRHLPVFTAAAVEEVAAFSAAAGQDVAWRLEMPSALVGMAMAGRLPVGQALAARFHTARIADLLARMPRDTEMTLHLCYGDLGNKAMAPPRDLTPAVRYLNLLAARLHDRGLSLPPVHIPVAHGADPAPTAEPFYRPLRELHPRWRVIAGIAAAVDPASGARALALFEAAAGRPAYAVATACGLGRHTPEAADKAVEAMIAAADAVTGEAAEWDPPDPRPRRTM
ncbi:hypothetical protein AB0K60_13120 [Thermopolyspora sp. NPDC052614]|uniref:hypothetical protein n=1 Tax=Thermopolyspora sp. NPDC052614 TaxID=3155682 RepID=UPI00342D939E